MPDACSKKLEGGKNPTTKRRCAKRKLSRNTRTSHGKRFCTLGARFACSVGAYRQKVPRRSSVGSSLRVRCWLGSLFPLPKTAWDRIFNPTLAVLHPPSQGFISNWEEEERIFSPLPPPPRVFSIISALEGDQRRREREALKNSKLLSAAALLLLSSPLHLSLSLSLSFSFPFAEGGKGPISPETSQI